jgi:hypothetical protein
MVKRGGTDTGVRVAGGDRSGARARGDSETGGDGRFPAVPGPALDSSRILASIPDDPEVERADLEARPIVTIPEGSPARLAVKGLAERVRSLCPVKD